MELLKKTIASIRPLDEDARSRARARLEQLIMPHWALGRLMDLAEELAAMTGSLKPPVARRCVVVMSGDHGIAKEGVSAYPADVTPQMVCNFVAGGAGINALSRVSNTRVVVVDMGVAADLSSLALAGKIIDKKVGMGTRSFLSGPAMSREEAARSVEAGIEVAMSLGPETDLFGTGDMGIGNTTPSSAITSVVTGMPAAEVTGRGTGIGDEQLRHKVAAIEKGLTANKPDPNDGVDVLAKVGGFEIGGIAGLILGAAAQGKPVLVDGFVSTAGALIAQMIEPKSALYMIAAHRSVEKGHRAALKRLGKEPLLDLDLRLGEGTGAALAMCLVEASVRILTEVATFAEARVSEKH